MRHFLLAGMILLTAQSPAHADAPRKADARVIFNTPAGDIVFALYPEIAPRHVKHFLRLVEEGVYDSTHFGRLEPGFVLQLYTAEDRQEFLSPKQKELLTPLKAEFSSLPHRRGIISMAHRDGDDDSGCSSFSILLGDAPHLDGKYTIFGEVERGMDVVEELSKVPTEKTHPRVKLDVRKAIVVSHAKQLAEINLEAAHPVPLPATFAESKSSTPAGIPLELAGGLGLIVAGGVACFLLSNYVPPKVLLSLVLLHVLIGSFLLLIVLTPVAQANSYIALAIFVALLGLLKLMSRFEGAT